MAGTFRRMSFKGASHSETQYGGFMTEFALYNYFRSSTSYRVRIALELKQIKYDYKPVHLLNNGGEQNSSIYRSLNPAGGVPTLVHLHQGQQKIIGQSLAIIEYIDDIKPELNPLFPKDPYAKSLVKQFCENINADTHPYGNLKTLQYLEKEFHIDSDQKTKWIQHWIDLGLSACEKMLTAQKGQFCFSDTLTAADLCLIPQLVSAERFQVDIKKYPQLYKVYNHCMTLDAFKTAHPFNQIDTPEDLKRNS